MDILQDMSPTRLAHAVEENLSSTATQYGLTGEYRVDDPPGVRRSISPIPLPLFNSIVDARLEADDVEMVVRQIKADAEAREVPVQWWIGPSTRPADLGWRLERYSFLLDDDSPGMAVELAKLNENLVVPPGLSIQVAQDERSLRAWSYALAMGFEAPASMIDFFVDTWSNFMRLVNPDITQAYLAKLEDEPVATALLHLGGGVAGIYGVSTIPEARRKGIGAQVTLYPLKQAREKGFKAGILEASEMGLGVYRALGFQEYCRISSYVYHPNASHSQARSSRYPGP